MESRKMISSSHSRHYKQMTDDHAHTSIFIRRTEHCRMCFRTITSRNKGLLLNCSLDHFTFNTWCSWRSHKDTFCNVEELVLWLSTLAWEQHRNAIEGETRLMPVSKEKNGRCELHRPTACLVTCERPLHTIRQGSLKPSQGHYTARIKNSAGRDISGSHGGEYEDGHRWLSSGFKSEQLR